MYSLSKKSIDKLQTCHVDLQILMEEAIKTSPVDFGISDGYRSSERQQILYKQGKSQKDGLNNKSKHNYFPSQAVDIFILNSKGEMEWEDIGLWMIAVKHIMATAERLKKELKISHKIRSGADWDMDKEYLTDQSFNDLPHFEII